MAGTAKTDFWDLVIKVIKNKWFWIVVAAIIVILYFYNQGKKAATGDQVDLPNSGSGIPLGWDPTESANLLYDAMDTGSAIWGVIDYGTDEQQIFDTLDPLTLDQCAAVNNEFNSLYQGDSGMTLHEWFESELDGDDLQRALAYFDGITGF